MNRLFFIFSALLLSGCMATTATNENRQMLLDQAREAMNEAHRCGLRNVADLDDKISDASTISLALAMKCQNEHIYAIRMYAISQNMLARYVEWLIQTKTTKDERVSFYLQTVLSNRR